MLTQMMQQYLEIKNKHLDAIVFYRLGDFYEMFFEDAKVASRELELTLTGRNCGDGERAPMCGVPFHSADMYIGRLVSKGYKVVICEQMEDPAQAKGLVKRDIVRVITPGTVIDNTQLTEEKNNFLCSVYFSANEVGVGFIDISTGELSSTSFDGNGYGSHLFNELTAFGPNEIIMNIDKVENAELNRYITSKHIYCGNIDRDRFTFADARKNIVEKVGVKASDALAEMPICAVCAVGALLSYVSETQLSEKINVSELKYYREGQYLEIDASSRRNLELCETMRTGEKKGSLLGVIDKTRTASGARLLRSWVEHPLMNTRQIVRRQNAVSELFGDYMLRRELSEQLNSVLDMDRLMTKVIYGTANARDLCAIASSAAVMPQIKELIANCTSEELHNLYCELDTLEDICDLINRAITDNPPATIREGGYIRRGYNAQADELSTIVNDGESYIKQIAANERELTGIKNLKISYNRVFGYYIEVSKSNLSEVPERYIRRQTLANGERFITEELKEKESLILGASDKLNALEYQLFTELREKITAEAHRIQKSAGVAAKLDAYASLAEVASQNNYCCPEIDSSDILSITEGRHPVVEKFQSSDVFVPNDTYLDTNHNRLAIITGPNMAGKSTYMRQTALVTVLAQIGSFVPAKEARIGVVDKIFTRVGASDDLASGQSTFMLEMNEVANILKNATKRSLIIYDEIGRGTSTYDGMSIAKAVAEYTASKKLGAKTLFATHYHELTSIENEIPGIVNYNIAAKKKGDDIVFFRKIIKGAADESYGIEVAKLAGIPGEVIKRAKDILKELSANDGKKPYAEEASLGFNLTLDDFKAKELREKLLNIDVNLITPVEALTLLAELKKSAE